MIEYKSIQPSIGEMKAIRDGDYSSYGIPCYEHYNWCLDYLDYPNNTVKRVTYENAMNIVLDRHTLDIVQAIMIKACTKYLKPRLWYDAPNGLWMCKSEEFHHTIYGETAQECYKEWNTYIKPYPYLANKAGEVMPDKVKVSLLDKFKRWFKWLVN